MDKNKAINYLKRKGKPETEENIKEVMKSGKIYGDPVIMCQ